MTLELCVCVSLCVSQEAGEGCMVHNNVWNGVSDVFETIPFILLEPLLLLSSPIKVPPVCVFRHHPVTHTGQSPLNREDDDPERERER